MVVFMYGREYWGEAKRYTEIDMCKGKRRPYKKHENNGVVKIFAAT